MENYYEKVNGNGVTKNVNHNWRQYNYQASSIKGSLSWLDQRVFYVKISKCEIDDSTPEYLALNHVPLNHNTLLEVNGVRTSMCSDGASTFLRRDRVDKKSEEVTFISTDILRMTGSVRFEVFDKDILLLSGALELCTSDESIGESTNQNKNWSLNCDCESNILAGAAFLKGNQYMSLESGSPAIEVYVAGCFSGSPIILTQTLQLGYRRKQGRKATLESIPEHEAAESQNDSPSGLPVQIADHQNYKAENEDYIHHYPGMEYLEGEDGELSWFNAGVRVGVGIGLSVCVGIGIGIGLLVKTYQGSARNLRRRPF